MSGMSGERRAFVRLSKSLTLRYKVVKVPQSSSMAPSDEEIQASTKDISAGGLAFYSKEKLPHLSILEVRLNVPGEDQPVICLAEVVRVRVVENTPFCDTALHFLDLSSHDRRILDKFVQKEMK